MHWRGENSLKKIRLPSNKRKLSLLVNEGGSFGITDRERQEARMEQVARGPAQAAERTVSRKNGGALALGRQRRFRPWKGKWG